MASTENDQDRAAETGSSSPAAVTPPSPAKPKTGLESELGSALLDLLPLPNDTKPVTDPDRHETSKTLHDDVTLSHAMARNAADATSGEPEHRGEINDDHDHAAGLVQRSHDEGEVLDVGWKRRKQDISRPLTTGLSNEELWILIRRFNKQVRHVRAIETWVPGNLDLNTAFEDEFSPEKLRGNLERLYITVLVNVLNTVKHLARLRSWRERPRTACFCAAYFVAWTFDYVMALLCMTLLVLILCEPSRRVLFPPAPLALVDSSSGGVQKPQSGALDSHDSTTGAPENFKGEAVEMEAQNFVAGILSAPIADLAPNTTALAADAGGEDTPLGAKPGAGADRTKKPMQTILWIKARPVVRGLAEFEDTWERVANALSPVPPFPRRTAQVRIALLVIPLLIPALFVSSYTAVKSMMFGAGFVFFGDPIISRGIHFLNRVAPNWRQLIELRNTILKGVPTNAQLTLTLLRIGEANRAPIPPPPRAGEGPVGDEMDEAAEHLRATAANSPLNAADEEVDEAVESVREAKMDSGGNGAEDHSPLDKQRGKWGPRIVAFFKGTSKPYVKTAIGVDAARAKVLGSRPAKDRLGVVRPPPPNPDTDGEEGEKEGQASEASGGGKGKLGLTGPRHSSERKNIGPVEFSARCGGHRGRVCISTAATVSAVAFIADGHASKAGGKKPGGLVSAVTHGQAGSGEADCPPLGKAGEGDGEEQHHAHANWTIPVADVAELRKFGGYGWKAKLLVGWSLDREVADGLEIKTVDGRSIRITACSMRDELFNRLVAMGGQKWESL